MNINNHSIEMSFSKKMQIVLKHKQIFDNENLQHLELAKEHIEPEQERAPDIQVDRHMMSEYVLLELLNPSYRNEMYPYYNHRKQKPITKKLEKITKKMKTYNSSSSLSGALRANAYSYSG